MNGNKKAMVYERLRQRIIECELQPGLPINEADFAREHSVSKNHRNGRREARGPAAGQRRATKEAGGE
jgi:hypothetical protein